MTRAETEEYSRRTLRELRSAGIRHVAVLGCNYEPDECDAYRAIKRDIFEIDFAPSLPLPGCDKPFCKCILLAIEEPKAV
jgi:hypothetical protein